MSAAERAYARAEAQNDGWPWDTTKDAMITAAEEALRPIRELVAEWEKTGHLDYAKLLEELSDE